MVAVLLAFSIGCAGDGSAASDEAAAALDSTATAPDTLATLTRLPCFGTCPSYSLTIFSDGTVTYEGRRFVAVEGRATAHIDGAAVQRLIEAFQTADYFDFQSAYLSGPVCDQHLSDLPTTKTSFHFEGRHQQVTHYHGCQGFPGEARLTELENTIDAIVGSARWIKGEEGAP